MKPILNLKTDSDKRVISIFKNGREIFNFNPLGCELRITDLQSTMDNYEEVGKMLNELRDDLEKGLRLIVPGIRKMKRKYDAYHKKQPY